MPCRNADGNVASASSGIFSFRRADGARPRTIAQSPSLRPSPNDTLSRTSASHSRAPLSPNTTPMHIAYLRNPRPPKTRLWISFTSSADAGREAAPKSSSHRRASSSVRIVPSPWRIAALVRMFVVVNCGYAEYQQPVGTCCPRAHRLKKSPSLAPCCTRFDARGNPSVFDHTAVRPRCAMVMKSSR